MIRVFDLVFNLIADIAAIVIMGEADILSGLEVYLKVGVARITIAIIREVAYYSKIWDFKLVPNHPILGFPLILMHI